MRMLPSRNLQGQILKVKKNVAQLKHISAPLKGLSLASKQTEGNPKTAIILDNVVIEENQIKCRPGSHLLHTHTSPITIDALIPHYGGFDTLVYAAGDSLCKLNGDVVGSGFTGRDWHWTSFSNLSAVDYTILVNGMDGVWSWDGAATSTNPPAIAVTSLSKSPAGGPATCTVDPANIGQFHNGDVVLIAGATGTGLVNANGYHVIYNVGSPANTFSLAGVDTSTASGPQTTGVTADPPGTGLIKEVVTAPAWAPHINPNQFQIVVSHMNRLWFADSSNLSVYYLPLQQKGGMVTELPLNAMFRRGGSIRAMYTWTVDGGVGLDDQLVIFSTNGECVIYSGLDPDSDFNLVGLFRFDSPMSKHCVVNYGGELYVLVSTGLVPMSTLMRAETDQLGQQDRNIYSLFFQSTFNYHHLGGWSAMLVPNSGRIICNMPRGSANKYQQAVRFMPDPVWATWNDIPARCWAWLDNRVFFGSDDGRIYEGGPNYLNDHNNMGVPQPIKVDIQTSWNAYGTSTIKQFKMVLPYITTDGVPKPFVDFRVDYSTAEPYNQPDVTEAAPGAVWAITDVDPPDGAVWAITQTDPPDGSYWASGERVWTNWQGISAIGRVGSVRLTASISNCTFAISGFDVLYEEGSVFG